MSTTTTNYGFTLPAVNDAADADLWGTELNANWSSLDTLLKTAGDNIHASASGTTTTDSTYRNKLVLCDASGGAFTINLQAAATAGDGFSMSFKKTDSSGNAVTIDPSGSESIEGVGSYDLNSQSDVIDIACDGTQWWIIADKTTATGVADASTSVKGILKLATNAMTKTGTDTATAVTPASLASLSGVVKAWVNFNGVLGISIKASNNVSGIVRNSIGNYTVTFTTAFADAFYAAIVTTNKDGVNNGNRLIKSRTDNYTTTTVDIIITGDSAYVDASVISLMVIR